MSSIRFAGMELPLVDQYIAWGEDCVYPPVMLGQVCKGGPDWGNNLRKSLAILRA